MKIREQMQGERDYGYIPHTCWKCKNIFPENMVYLFGYWYYDGDGNTFDVGKKRFICHLCLEKIKKEPNQYNIWKEN